MENEIKVSIEKYGANEMAEYKYRLNNFVLPYGFYILPSQELKYDKKVFLMISEYTKKILFVKVKMEDLIGYCIVENANALPDNWMPYIFMLYSIPIEILNGSPIVISDFMIAQSHRRQRYGSQLANYVINNEYSSANISLHAVENGPDFWGQFGFKYVDGADSVMELRR